MNKRQKYFDSIKRVVDGIKHTAINHNIQPNDLMDIWAAGIACTSSLCPEKLGANHSKTMAEMEAAGAVLVQKSTPAAVTPKVYGCDA